MPHAPAAANFEATKTQVGPAPGCANKTDELDVLESHAHVIAQDENTCQVYGRSGGL
jgi:hypothetical protein